MADIFVSYSRQDRKRVEPLIALLEQQGWTVWWDREINPGESFDELIELELDQARAIVVVWSQHSVASRWVRNEALEAADRNILVPVRLDNERIPVAFRQSQVADLTRWPGRVDPVEIEHLLTAIGAKLGQDQFLVPDLPQSRRGRKVGIAAGLVALIALCAVAALYWRDAQTDPHAGTEMRGLAVLHPQAGSASPEESFLADSLADEITEILRGAKELQVSSTTAAWELPQDLTRQQIAERLNVRYLVEGEVERGPAGTAVQIRLVDAQADATLIDRTFAAGLTSVRTLRLEIARAILGQMGISRKRIEAVLNAADTVSDEKAYQLYLRAKAVLRRSGENEALGTARDLLLQAVQRDPGFGAAYSGLCRADLGMFRIGGALHYFSSAERACYRALTIGSGNAEAQLALGDLYDLSGQYEQARGAYERALDLDPMLSEALIGLGHALAMQGDAERAHRAYLRASEIQPGYWRTHNSLGWFYMHEGRYVEAIDAYTQVTYLAPGNAWGFSNRGGARFATGDFAGAIADWERSAKIDPESGALSNMGTAHFYLRDYANALSMYRKALDHAPADYQIWLNVGDALRFVDADQASADQSPAADARDAYRQAIRYAKEELTVNPGDPVAKSAEARALAYLGESSRAKRRLSEIGEISKQNAAVLYNVTLAQLSLGAMAEAERCLRAAITAGYPAVYARNDPLFDPLRESGALAAVTAEPL